MKQKTIDQYRQRVLPRLGDYLRAERIPFSDVDESCECPHCHQLAFFLDGKYWLCDHCARKGDVLDLARSQYPGRDDWSLLRHICRKLRIKVDTMDVFSAAELAEQEFPPRRFLVEGLLPREGLFLLAAPAKTGKSWLVLQLASALVRGESFLELPTEQTRVLYLSLEDHRQRLYERAEQTGGLGSPDLLFCTEAELLGKGFEEALCGVLEQEQGVGLVIIDTLQKIREIDRDGYSYSRDYDVMNRLKAISQRFSLAVLLVHHTNKMEETGDEMNRVSGTTAMTGGVDGTWVLRRPDRMQGEAIMQVSSRDTEDMRLRLRFDREKLCWSFLGREEEPVSPPDETALLFRALSALAGEGEWLGSPEELCETLRKREPRLQGLSAVKLGRWLRREESALWTRGVGVENRRNKSRTILLFLRPEQSAATDTTDATDPGESP